jgi:hypothetical protein
VAVATALTRGTLGALVAAALLLGGALGLPGGTQDRQGQNEKKQPYNRDYDDHAHGDDLPARSSQICGSCPRARFLSLRQGLPPNLAP